MHMKKFKRWFNRHWNLDVCGWHSMSIGSRKMVTMQGNPSTSLFCSNGFNQINRSDKNVLWFHQTRYDIFELMPCKNMLGQAYQTFETQGKTLVRSHKLILYTSQQRHCIVRHFSSSNNTKRPPTLRLHEVHNITWDNMTYMEHHTQCFLHSLGKRWYVKSRYHVCRYIKQINKYLIPITANITMIVHTS